MFRRLVIHDNLTYYPMTMTDKPMAFTAEPELGMGAIEKEFMDEQLSLTNL